MNQRGFVNIILVIVAVALIIGVGYFILVRKSTPITQQTPTSSSVSPTPTPTPVPINNVSANWKTYSNDEYKYEIKYPANWKFYYPISVPQEGAKPIPAQDEYVPLKAVVYFEPTDIKFAEDDYSLKGVSISLQDKRGCEERFSAKAVISITVNNYRGIEFNATYGWIGGEQERYHIVLCVNNKLVEFQSHLERKNVLKEMIKTFRPL